MYVRRAGLARRLDSFGSRTVFRRPELTNFLAAGQTRALRNWFRSPTSEPSDVPAELAREKDLVAALEKRTAAERNLSLATQERMHVEQELLRRTEMTAKASDDAADAARVALEWLEGQREALLEAEAIADRLTDKHGLRVLGQNSAHPNPHTSLQGTLSPQTVHFATSAAAPSPPPSQPPALPPP